MPLRAFLAALVLLTPMALVAEDERPPAGDARAETKEIDLHAKLADDVRSAFRARTPVQEIATQARIEALKGSKPSPESLEAWQKMSNGMPFIRVVQKGIASPEERYRAFDALGLQDEETLYLPGEKPVIPADLRAKLEAEAAELAKKYEAEKLDPDQRAKIGSRMTKIAQMLGVGAVDEAPFAGGGAPVIMASMVPGAGGTPQQAAAAYRASGKEAHLYETLRTFAPPPAAARKPLEPYTPPNALQRFWNNAKAIDLFKKPEAKDYFSGGQGQVLAAVHQEAERIVKDSNFRHDTLDHVYQKAPERYKKALIEWQILKNARYGGEKALIDKYGLKGVTVADVADADHFHAASTLSAVPGPGTIAGILGTVVYDGGQVGRDLWRGNWESAKYNLKQIGTDLKGVVFGATLLAPGG
ncbi:MAG: hypothetical protein AUJ52_03195 [Elusimicrobia bacterium CG1_02_63_36]|nr:MAG: hypothetical protein AUJ52_03195 [Elusimicrobia bacterium CG1_02_63_36]PIP82778.1 MAG: hypothetical protein COR54_12825 [Elusimicrobia bacterium CG22_combo_CG10-13_8_21_14_all_63_91]PJA16085.1 MAG: hypothetical protein COX66_08305 [Elusimicrobia bacterium CG_4_10_14_0_2_um_filter_63_34]PJB24672.1 MAG: hypothetical protein CO113_12475 [Elusimicrobia bacterium CG_4_9_14_3_um_filter_62_55]